MPTTKTKICMPAKTRRELLDRAVELSCLGPLDESQRSTITRVVSSFRECGDVDSIKDLAILTQRDTGGQTTAHIASTAIMALEELTFASSVSPELNCGLPNANPDGAAKALIYLWHCRISSLETRALSALHRIAEADKLSVRSREFLWKALYSIGTRNRESVYLLHQDDVVKEIKELLERTYLEPEEDVGKRLRKLRDEKESCRGKLLSELGSKVTPVETISLVHGMLKKFGQEKIIREKITQVGGSPLVDPKHRMAVYSPAYSTYALLSKVEANAIGEVIKSEEPIAEITTSNDKFYDRRDRLQRFKDFFKGLRMYHISYFLVESNKEIEELDKLGVRFNTAL